MWFVIGIVQSNDSALLEGGTNYSQQMMQMEEPQRLRKQSDFLHFWKLHDAKAQKNGAHRTVYWVQRKKK